MAVQSSFDTWGASLCYGEDSWDAAATGNMAKLAAELLSTPPDLSPDRCGSKLGNSEELIRPAKANSESLLQGLEVTTQDIMDHQASCEFGDSWLNRGSRLNRLESSTDVSKSVLGCRGRQLDNSGPEFELAEATLRSQKRARVDQVEEHPINGKPREEDDLTLEYRLAFPHTNTIRATAEAHPHNKTPMYGAGLPRIDIAALTFHADSETLDYKCRDDHVVGKTNSDIQALIDGSLLTTHADSATLEYQGKTLCESHGTSLKTSLVGTSVLASVNCPLLRGRRSEKTPLNLRIAAATARPLDPSKISTIEDPFALTLPYEGYFGRMSSVAKVENTEELTLPYQGLLIPTSGAPASPTSRRRRNSMPAALDFGEDSTLSWRNGPPSSPPPSYPRPLPQPLGPPPLQNKLDANLTMPRSPPPLPPPLTLPPFQGALGASGGVALAQGMRTQTNASQAHRTSKRRHSAPPVAPAGSLMSGSSMQSTVVTPQKVSRRSTGSVGERVSGGRNRVSAASRNKNDAISLNGSSSEEPQWLGPIAKRQRLNTVASISETPSQTSQASATHKNSRPAGADQTKLQNKIRTGATGSLHTQSQGLTTALTSGIPRPGRQVSLIEAFCFGASR